MGERCHLCVCVSTHQPFSIELLSGWETLKTVRKTNTSPMTHKSLIYPEFHFKTLSYNSHDAIQDAESDRSCCILMFCHNQEATCCEMCLLFSVTGVLDTLKASSVTLKYSSYVFCGCLFDRIALISPGNCCKQTTQLPSDFKLWMEIF